MGFVADIGASLLGGVGTFLGIAGTATQAFGAFQQGQAQEAALAYQSQVAHNNAISARAAAAESRRRAELAADDAIAAGKIAESNRRREIDRLLGRQVTQFGGSGAIVGSGGQADVLADTVALGEFDALTIRSNAEREAQRLRLAGEDAATNALAQAAGQTAQAAVTGQAAGQAGTAGTISAFSTLLSGGANVASKWYAFNRET